MMVSGMQKRIVALTVMVQLLFLFCIGCTASEVNFQTISVQPKIRESIILKSRKNPITGASEYNNAIAAYNKLLFHGGIFREVEADKSVVPIQSTRYVLNDIDYDGIPELLVNSYVERTVYDDDGGIFTPINSRIFAYKDGEIYTWFNAYGHPFELLNNGAILQIYKRFGNSETFYSYLNPEDIENVQIGLSGVTREDQGGNIDYKIRDRSVSEDKWNESVGFYFSLPSDKILWTYYDWDNKQWPGEQDVSAGSDGKDESRDIECGEGYTATIFKRPESQHNLLSYEITLGKDNSLYFLVVHCTEGMNTVTVFDSTNIQLQEFTIESTRSGGDIVDFIDANLDGYVDLTITLGGTINEEKALWLWNPSTRGFDRVISSEPLFYFEVYEGYIKNWARLNQTTTDVQIFTWESDHVLKLDSNERIVLE